MKHFRWGSKGEGPTKWSVPISYEVQIGPKGLQTRVQDQEEAKQGVSYMASIWRETLMMWTKKQNSKELS